NGTTNDNLIEVPGFNQQWEFEPIGAGWGLRCVSREKKIYLKYLVPSTERGLRHESPLLASGFPVVWDIEKVDWVIRWPRSDGDSGQGKDQLVVDLSDWGSNRSGTRVQLAREQNPTHPCQLWRVVEC
ncbi:hypothetical protein K435DRAFT_569116, partial [Dendrothele bispora CBS 962.96]